MKSILFLPALAALPLALACASSGAATDPGRAPVPHPIPGVADSAAAHPAIAAEPPHAAHPPIDLAEAVAVYRGDGTSVSLEDLIAATDTVEVLFVGEAHDDMVGHAFQVEVLERILDRNGSGAATAPTGRPVILSMEMFERDIQTVVDEYLDGLITEEHFQASARPWPDYEERYQPLVELARARGIEIVAANAPRRYVNLVSREGPEALIRLPEDARASLPPLPIAPPSEAYRAELLQEMAGHAAAAAGAAAGDTAPGRPPGDSTAAPADPALERTFQAQALWDAAMAHSIAQALAREPRALVVHLSGSFHVLHRTGIPEHLDLYRPSNAALVVVVEPVDDPSVFPERMEGAGEFVVLTRRGGS